ncbi:MAG: hypothetical protein PGN11_20070 [Quadrisphaera sp.]
MLTTDRCASVRGIRQQCELGVLHEGAHVNGVRSWPRSARESTAFQQEVARARELRERALALRQQR